MAISKALYFVKQVKTDPELRKQCNKSESKESLLHMLGFTNLEFEDAINMNLVKCQTYEEAGYFKEIKDWFMLL